MGSYIEIQRKSKRKKVAQRGLEFYSISFNDFSNERFSICPVIEKKWIKKYLYSCTKYVGGQNNTPCLGNHKIYEKEMEYLVFFCQQKKNTFLLANLCTENIKILILHILSKSGINSIPID